MTAWQGVYQPRFGPEWVTDLHGAPCDIVSILGDRATIRINDPTLTHGMTINCPVEHVRIMRTG